MINKSRFAALAAAGLLAFGLAACSDSESSKDPVSPSDPGSSSSVVKELNRAQRIVRDMGPGINLGNVFEAPNTNFGTFDATQFTSNWGETILPENFVALGDSGFRNMRIPASWEEHVSGEGENCVVDPDWMNQVFWAVDLAIQNKMVVVLNTHHWDAIYEEDPEVEIPCLLSVYKQMMERVKTYSPDSLVVETLNEPRGEITSARWNKLVAQIVDVVRTADPERVVMVGSYNYNSYSSISMLEVPDVDNLIVTFHYYDPFNFTHQGATFVDPMYETGTLWTASLAQKRAVKSAFNAMKEWSDAHDIPVYLGEFGAYEEADDLSRETWTTYISQLATSLGFGKAYWEFCSGFGVYDDRTGEWRPYLMRALLNPAMSFAEETYPDLSTMTFALLDDFDQNEGDNINVNAISANIEKAKGNPVDSAAGRWYAYYINTSTMVNDAGEAIVTSDMVSDSTNEYTETNFQKLITANGHEGRGLYAKIHLEGDSYPWAGIGTNFDGDKRFNFANLKALSFWAKGTGNIKVGWKTDYADTCCTQNWGTFNVEINLTNEWKQYTIWYDQWVPSPWSELEELGAEWMEHNDDVSHLQFSNGSGYGEVVDDEIEIWLDDIRFYGMDGSEFGIK